MAGGGAEEDQRVGVGVLAQQLLEEGAGGGEDEAAGLEFPVVRGHEGEVGEGVPGVGGGEEGLGPGALAAPSQLHTAHRSTGQYYTGAMEEVSRESESNEDNELLSLRYIYTCDDILECTSNIKNINTNTNTNNTR